MLRLLLLTALAVNIVLVASTEEAPTCSINEEYSNCTQAICRQQECSKKGEPVACPLIIGDGCLKGCVCKKSFLKDANGNCIPEDQCPQECKYGGTWNTCPPQPCKAEYCAKSRNDPSSCASTKNCGTPRCTCGFNQKRDRNGKCINIRDCPPFECGVNEEYNACPSFCSDNCTARNTLCPNPRFRIGVVLTCTPKCVCKKNYYRNSKGLCVTSSQCDEGPKCNVNEEYSNCTEAVCRQQECSKKEEPVACPDIVEEKCSKGCLCKEFFLKDANGNCIPEDQCPQKPKCNINEEYSDCTQVVCRQQECSKKGDPIACPCIEEKDCLKGCVCKEFFLRDANGNCIPEDQCPPKQCLNQNEMWVACPKPCDPNTCESIGKKFHCPKQKQRLCKGECRCKPGYWRNVIGDCITKEECLQCNKKNEFFSCGGACDNVCSNLNQQNQTNCPIINIKCNPMCYCKTGYARDSFGECIPISECRNCTGDHEWYDKCPRYCSPETCPIPGIVYDCAQPPDPPQCYPSCRCEDNYRRNASGVCVPLQDCPCGDDPNAIYGSGCGVSCDRLCSTYNSTEPIACPDICYTDRCDCKKGFVYDEIRKLCVLPKDCTPECKNGGTWNTCPPQPCKAEYCAKSRDDPSSCTSTKNCGTPRCTCGFNQKIDCNGKCIDVRDCPPFPCGSNEKYDACPSFCGDKCTDRNSTCGDPRFKIGVVVKCAPKCVCKKNFFRNSKGVCVESCQCDEDTITATPATTTTTDNGNDAYDLELLKQGVNDFTYKFLKKAIKLRPGENLIFSSVSVQLAYSLLVLYSRNNTQRQLLDSFGLSSPDQFRRTINPFVNSLKSSGNVTFNSAILVAFNKIFEATPEFKEDTKLVDGEMEYIDCSNPPEAAETVNSYVEKNTDGKIKNLIPQDAIDESVRVILVNALYFKGLWKKPFNKNQTSDKVFYTYDNRAVSVPTMYMESKMPYSNSTDLQAQVVKLECADPNYYVVIVLPYEKDGLPKTIDKLNPDTMQKALDNMRTQDIKLWVPTMKIETTYSLNQQLQDMGLTDMFNPRAANFTGILKKPEDLCVSKVVHKAAFELNEDGAVAAAATAVVVRTFSALLPPQPKPEVKCDHPFLVIILAGKTAAFVGLKLN